MSADAPAPPARPTFPWWIVLCLVGLDYFSSLAYLPSIAVSQMRELGAYTSAIPSDQLRALAPVAALGVVLVTLFGALPVYLYVVGRSPHGKGGVGLLEQRFKGWGGKLAVLVLLGFVAADFVLTRSISVSDAAAHIHGNAYYQGLGSWTFREWLPGLLPEGWRGWVNEQLAISVLLTIAAFGFYFFLVRSLSRGFLGAATGIVLLYLALNVTVIGAGLRYIWQHPHLVGRWEASVRPAIGDLSAASTGTLGFLVLLALATFPPMAIGLSGFEMTMASAPLVRGAERDDPHRPGWRIFNSRLMMIAAALIMCVLVLSSVFVVTLLVPDAGLVKDGEVQHRSLSYLAHGGRVIGEETEGTVFSLFGNEFGLLYDLSTILVLCLAGAAATVSLRDIVPDFLTRFGMQMQWARQLGVILHLFNLVILVVTIVFKASVTDQQWAYSTSVLALLFGASLAATLDVRASWKDSWLKHVLQLPFLLATVVFGLMGLLITYQRPSGMLIGLGFVVVVLSTAIVSRWVRSTAPRFEKLRFASQHAEDQYEMVRALEFQVLVPHARGSRSLADKEAEIRQTHRIPAEVPVLFVEVEVGDPSDFAVQPQLDVVNEEGRMVLLVEDATSVPHALAAIALAFRETGVPPEMHFAWAEESPLEANLNFVLLGHGNVPWMVHELIRKAEPDPAKRPRVIVG
ncbi:MAG: amino acid transporter [Gemmataceae bacterium]|nr:amino acid transporter [Gemmataceae bacterium]